MTPPRLHPAWPTVTVVLVFLVQVASCFFLDPAGCWTTDDASKFLQVRQILRSHYSDYSIPWRGAETDPNFTCCPIPPPFGVRVDGKIYSQYAPFFATISAPFFETWGYPGLYVLPLWGSLAALFAVSWLARLVQDTPVFRSLAVALTGLCTPVWFYSLIFWEHLPALGLILWGLYFCFRFIRTDAMIDLFLGILFSVAAVYFREEMILSCLLMLGMILRDKPDKRIALAIRAILFGAICIAPLLLFNSVTLGTPFGHHVSSNFAGPTSHLTSRAAVFYNLLIAAHPDPVISLIVGIPFVALLYWKPVLPKRSFTWGFPALAVTALVYFGISFSSYWTSSSPIRALLNANSLFAASPLLLLGLVRTASTVQPPVVSRLWALAIGYTLLYWMAAPAISSQGIHWGNRFLLLVYPLLTLCAAVNITHWWRRESTEVQPSSAGRVAVLAVIAVCLFAQLYSLHLLQRQKAFSVRLNDAVLAEKETAILTDVWWVPQMLHSVFFDRQLFFARSPEDAQSLVARLRERHQYGYLFVTGASNTGGMKPDRSINDGGLNFFSLALFKCTADTSRKPEHGGEGPTQPGLE